MGNFTDPPGSGGSFLDIAGENTVPGFGFTFNEANQGGPIDIKTGTPGSIGPSNPASDSLMDFANQYATQTDPLRRNLVRQSNQFLKGNFDVTGTPQYASLQGAANTQFENARQNILASVPNGGALTDALTQAELARAGVLTQGAGSIADSMNQQAYGLATGGAQLATQGLGSAGMSQAGQASARAQERSAVIGAKGEMWSGAMGGMGNKAGGK